MNYPHAHHQPPYGGNRDNVNYGLPPNEGGISINGGPGFSYRDRSESLTFTNPGAYEPQTGLYSRSVPNFAYHRTVSTGALTGQNTGTCDSGIGSEGNGSQERLGCGANSRGSLQSESIDTLDGVVPGKYYSRDVRERTHSIREEDDDLDDLPPPPPDVAQHDLMMRLGLLLGDHISEVKKTQKTSPVGIQTEDPGIEDYNDLPESSNVPVDIDPRDRRLNPQHREHSTESLSSLISTSTGDSLSPHGTARPLHGTPTGRQDNTLTSQPASRQRNSPLQSGAVGYAATSVGGVNPQQSGYQTAYHPGDQRTDRSHPQGVTRNQTGPQHGVWDSQSGASGTQAGYSAIDSNNTMTSVGYGFGPRPHSITTTAPGSVEEIFGGRKSVTRRSERSNWSNRQQATMSPLKYQHVHLKKLEFEIPHQDKGCMFVGREWLFRDILKALEGGSGLVLTGSLGSGKTAVVQQLVEQSCFGGHRKSVLVQSVSESSHKRSKYGYYGNNNNNNPPKDSLSSINQHSSSQQQQPLHLKNSSSTGSLTGSYECLQTLAECIVGYHICQADNNITCMVPEFVHSIAAYMAASPRLTAYKEYLQENPAVKNELLMKHCIENPAGALVRGVLDPLSKLKDAGRIDVSMCVLLLDALNEAEFHKPDYGDTISSFLTRHVSKFPPWLKLVVTTRSTVVDLTHSLPFHTVNLDEPVLQDFTNDDLCAYIVHRVQSNPDVRSNLSLSNNPQQSSDPEFQARFIGHVQALSKGSFLYCSLLLDLIERGSLVVKSANFKILPVNLTEIFLLLFNLKFPTIRSFEKVLPILNVCLATLYPLTAREIFESVNAAFVHSFLEYEEFCRRLKVLREFLIERVDGTYLFFHPAFREWLLKREEGHSNKFMCDLRPPESINHRNGHMLLAFKLSRVDAPLDADKTIELGHHILKAHIYKSAGKQRSYSSKHMQAYWMASSSRSLGAALVCPHNLYTPNVKVSRLMLISGAGPNTRTEEPLGDPPVCVAAEQGHLDFLSLLLEFGADPNLTGDKGDGSVPALCQAARKGHIEMIRMLVSYKACLNQTDHRGWCALVYAADGGQLDAVSALLQFDWKSLRNRHPQRNEALQQALVAAAGNGHHKICSFLMSLKGAAGDGFDINNLDSLRKETALTVCCQNGHGETASRLLELGANPHTVNKRGQSPMMCAAQYGRWEAAQVLLNKGVEPDATDRLQRTALMVAAVEGRLAVLDMLLSKGASVKKADAEGMTALSFACAKGYFECMLSLVEKGSELEHCDKYGRTPLYLAAFNGHADLVQYLIERGVDMERTDSSGLRPLDSAISRRNTAAIVCFLKKGAKLGPETWAMAQGKPDILALLLNKLMEDGNMLYKKNRIKEAAHRYHYALKKFPQGGHAFHDLKVNMLLNLSRCKRKLGETGAAIDLATKALEIKPKSFEAYYARARAKRDEKQYHQALQDTQCALTYAPVNPELKRLYERLLEECKRKHKV